MINKKILLIETNCFVNSIIYTGIILGQMLLQNSALAQQTVTGIARRATQHVQMNFSSLKRHKDLQRRKIGPELHAKKKLNSPGKQLLKDTPDPSNKAVQLPSPPPVASYQAVADNNLSIPPDTFGAVGPAHVMTTLNTEVRIQKRNGTTISTIGLNEFWQELGNFDAFDPRVLYDPYSQRWIICAVADAGLSSASIFVGVSQTNDPTKNWNLYRLDSDSANLTWSDFPIIGFNKQWIVITTSQYSNINDNFDTTKIFVLNKADFYNNGLGNYVELQDTTGSLLAPAITYNQTSTAMYLLEDWFDGQLRLSRITGSVSNPVFSGGIAFPTSPGIWSTIPSTGEFAPQLGSKRKIDGGDSRLGSNIIERNGSLWAVHTIYLPANNPTRSAIQWWQISKTGSVLQRGRIDDATRKYFYAYPSIGVNKNNDVLIGYSRFSSSQYPSANFAYRSGTDAKNTLRADTVLKAGEGPYEKDFNDFGNDDIRWGDYSATVVDPVNDLNFWTIQEYAKSLEQNDHRWGTWWGNFTTNPKVADLRVTQSDSPATIAANGVLTYNISVTNLGPITASKVILRDSLVSSSTLSSITTTAGTCLGTRALTCNLGDLTNGQKVDIILKVKSTGIGNIKNIATVTSSTVDTNPTNNIAYETTNERCFGAIPTIVGTKDDDHLIGTTGNDVIIGRSGNDTIQGLGGNDLLCGGEGNDLLQGGPGNDKLTGEVGSDNLQGDAGSDTCIGEFELACEL